MSVRKSLVWAFTGQFATFAINFFGSVIIARLLTPTEMGVYALAQATTGILAVVTAFGVVSYVIREVELSDQKLASAFTVNAAVSLFLAVAIFIASYWLDENNPTVRAALQIMALSPLGGMLEFRPFAVMQREQRFQTSSMIGTTGTLINMTMTIALALKGFSSMSMPIAALTASAFRVVAFNLAMPHHARLRVSFADWREITTFGFRMTTIRGAAILAQRGSEMVLGRFLGLAALGTYTRASILSQQIFFNVYGTATQVVFAEMSRAYRETGTARDTFLRGLDMILAFMWPLLIGIAVLARPAIYILYGPNWMGAALPLALLMIAQFFSLSFGMNWELFVLRNETAKQTRYELFRMAIGLAIFSGGALINLAAASLGRVAEALIGTIIYLPQMTTLSGAQTSDLIAIYRRSLTLTAAAVAPSLLLMIANNWSETTSPLVIATSVFIGVGFWLVVLRTLKHPVYDEIRRFVRIVPLQAARIQGRGA
jgi:O-antigen/teichoic acid export membrane protein